MTTATETSTRVTVSGILDGMEVKGEKVTYKIKRDADRRYPDWYVAYWRRDTMPTAPILRDGHSYSFLCDEKTKPGADGKPKTYHDLVDVNSIKEVTAEPAVPASTPPPATPAARAPAPTATAAPLAAVPPRQTPSGYDEHERATDARTAIMQAVEYESAKIPQEEVHIERVINAAERIYAWLRAQHQAATGASPDVYPDDGSRDQSREPAAEAAAGFPPAPVPQQLGDPAATHNLFPRKEADFKRYGDLLNHAATDFGWDKKRVLKELAIERLEDLVETPPGLFAMYLELKAKAGK